MSGLFLRTARGSLVVRDRCAIMGILNCTPDSFSDGGRYLDLEAALSHARNLIAQGADILDIGGDSTRPLSQPVSAEEECRRVLPLIRELRRETDIPISIDTHKAKVAQGALEAGADMVNDISALGDPDMLSLCADTGAACILMHMQGTPQTMQLAPGYADTIHEIMIFLEEKIKAAVAGGLERDRILVDPGIGFGKTLEDNLQILANLDAFRSLGCPLLLGASRKRFLRTLTTRHGREPAPSSTEVLAGTLTTSILAAQAKVSVIRVHDVAATRAAFDVLDAIERARP